MRWILVGVVGASGRRSASCQRGLVRWSPLVVPAVLRRSYRGRTSAAARTASAVGGGPMAPRTRPASLPRPAKRARYASDARRSIGSAGHCTTCGSRSPTAATSAARIACPRRSSGATTSSCRATRSCPSRRSIGRPGFVALGVEKLRITGGEPLVRRDLPDLVGMLAALRTPDGGRARPDAHDQRRRPARARRPLADAGPAAGDGQPRLARRRGLRRDERDRLPGRPGARRDRRRARGRARAGQDQHGRAARDNEATRSCRWRAGLARPA